MERNRSIDVTNVSIDFSVIIPTFRRPRELIEAISSVLRQPESTVEIFVIDDSPEGSAEEETRGLRDSRIVYVKNPSPIEGSAANAALIAA